MPLVRLQCPACASIVKISEEIAAQHPLVRCARCQGLVNVTTCRVIEPVASREQDDVSFKPRKKKRRASNSTAPVALIVGIVVGLLVLVGAGFGVYFLIDHFGGSPLDKQFKRGLAIMQKMADAFDTIQTPQDVPKAFDQIKACAADLKQLDEDNRKAGIDTHGEQANKVAEKYMPEYLKLSQRIMGTMTKLAMNPAMAQAVRDNIAGLGPDLQQAMMRGGLNQQALQPPRNFGNNTPQNNVPLQPGDASPNQFAPQQLENALLIKNLSLQNFPKVLEEVHDAESARWAMVQVEGIVLGLHDNEERIRRLEREIGKATTPAAQKAMSEIEKSINELAVHLARIEKLPDLGDVHARMVRKLSEVGLAPTTGTTASNKPAPGKDTGNPFESVPSGSAGRSGQNRWGQPVRIGSFLR
ncbi:MAG: hypothetical protein QM703_13490 [Gemmatales bacterium]